MTLPKLITFMFAFAGIVLLSTVIHEAVHVLQAKAQQQEVYQVCLLGYTTDAVGWVRTEKAQGEVYPYIAQFTFAIISSAFIAWHYHGL